MLGKLPALGRIVCLLLAVSLMAGLIGCKPTRPAPTAESGDILTQKPIDAKKIPVTVLVKYAFSANAFEQAAEARFPNLDLIQVGNYTDNSSNELEQRMKNDDLPDIVFTWPQDVGSEYFEQCLLDLSGMSFTSRYNISVLDKLSDNGKLYYFPGPSQVRGLVYNKTLFEEHGWQVPTSYEEFLSLCREIEAAGIRPLQLSLKEPGVIETAFWGFGYSGTLGRPQQMQALVNFENGKGSFGDFSQSAFASFERLIDEGVLRPEDLNVQYFQRTDMLFARQCAMLSDGASMTHIGMVWANNSDEFALMPFFSPGAPEDWAQIFFICLIGLNKHLAEPQNKQKYELVLQLMDYISSPEGQLALAGDDGGMISSVTTAALPSIPEINNMDLTLQQGRYAPFPTLSNAQSALHAGLREMLAGRLSAEDVIRLVDRQNANPPTPVSSRLLGTAQTTFTLIETGNFITDAMRVRGGTDIALFLDNGKDGQFNARGVSAKLYEGDITEDDIEMRVLPVLQHNERGVLHMVTMTGADLVNALEYTLDDGDWFYYFSGLRMEYAPSAAPGSRIRSLTDANEQPIDPAKSYTVAMMDGSVDKRYIQSVQETELLISTLVCDAIEQAQRIAPAQDGRFVVAQP